MRSATKNTIRQVRASAAATSRKVVLAALGRVREIRRLHSTWCCRTSRATCRSTITHLLDRLRARRPRVHADPGHGGHSGGSAPREPPRPVQAPPRRAHRPEPPGWVCAGRGEPHGDPLAATPRSANMIATAMWLRQGNSDPISASRTPSASAPISCPALSRSRRCVQRLPVRQLDHDDGALLGTEVKELDSCRGALPGRGCVSQAQIAGARVVLDCATMAPGEDGPGVASAIYIGTETCCDDKTCGPLGKCQKPSKGTCSTDTLTSTEGPGYCTCTTDDDCPAVCTYAEGSCRETLVCQGGHWQAEGKKCDDTVSRNPLQCPSSAPKAGDACTVNAAAVRSPPASAGSPSDPDRREYELATSNYLAAGGSGFFVLQRQHDAARHQCGAGRRARRLHPPRVAVRRGPR